MDDFIKQGNLWLKEQLASIKDSEIHIEFIEKRMKNDREYIKLLFERITIDRDATINFINENKETQFDKEIIKKIFDIE